MKDKPEYQEFIIKGYMKNRLNHEDFGDREHQCRWVKAHNIPTLLFMDVYLKPKKVKEYINEIDSDEDEIQYKKVTLYRLPPIVAMACVRLEKNIYSWGISLLSKKDSYNRKRGIQIARARACNERNISAELSGELENYYDNIRNLIMDCIADETKLPASIKIE